MEAESPARRWCMFFSSSRGSSLQQPHIINHDLALAHTRAYTQSASTHANAMPKAQAAAC
jgi:hypothetical protein